MLSLTRWTVRSFPGITDEEKMIVSSFLMVIYLWLPAIIRGNAAISSPWAPVQTTITLLSGYSLIRSMGMTTSLGTLMYPNWVASSIFIFMEKPSSATFLLLAAANSMTCLMRSIWLEKVAIMVRPGALPMILLMLPIISCSVTGVLVTMAPKASSIKIVGLF